MYSPEELNEEEYCDECHNPMIFLTQWYQIIKKLYEFQVVHQYSCPRCSLRKTLTYCMDCTQVKELVSRVEKELRD